MAQGSYSTQSRNVHSNARWNRRDLQASYVGARGMHLLRRHEANFFPAPVTLPGGSLFFPDDCAARVRLGLEPSALCRPTAGALNPAFGSVPTDPRCRHIVERNLPAEFRIHTTWMKNGLP